MTLFFWLFPGVSALTLLLMIRVFILQKRLREQKKTSFENTDALLRAGRQAAAVSLIPAAVHDFRQPMSVICGYLALLQFRLGKNSEYKEYLDLCSQSMDKLNGDLARFRDIARADAGLTPVAIRLPAVLDDVTSFLTEQLQSRGIVLRRDIPDDLPPILFSAQDLQFLFFSLINNAKDALAKGDNKEKTITVSARTESGKLRVIVQDNGCGMTPETRAHCFDLFFTTGTDHAGLGLPWCRAIMEHYAGTLQLESEAGSGCKVTLTFPLQ
ncbi:MAG: HAMP domain-containing histidine kinase [Lentisphaeria bacterium]|nr:HAMP domain-containing histidine kinase [Lentisphaeria bacterium]